MLKKISIYKTPMQCVHLKKLVHEKKRRNSEAKQNHEEPDWIIQGGILCRRPGVADVEADIDQVYHQLNCSIVFKKAICRL